MHCGADLSGYKVEISPKIEVKPNISISTLDKEQISLLVGDKLSKALEKAHTFKDIKGEEITPEEYKAMGTLLKIGEEVDRNGMINLSKYDPQDLERCVKFIDKVLEETEIKSKDKEVAWLFKGAILTELCKYSEALKCWNKVVEINPRNYTGWSNKGNNLKKLKRYDEAMHCFNKALDINPEYEKAWAEKGAVVIGQSIDFIRESAKESLDRKMSIEEYESKNSELKKEAMRYINKALEINPRFESAWMLKSSIEEDINEKISCLDKALEINPRSATALLTKGFLKHFFEALEFIDFPDGDIKRGKLLEWKSRLWEVIEYYNKALEIEPNNAKALKWREVALKDLRNLS